jgi:hypothetical protein
MEKIAKQQRSKMKKFQICNVQQILTTKHMKCLLQVHSQRGIDKHQISPFSIDACYLHRCRLQLA